MSMGELDALARRSFLKGIGIAGFGAVGASLLAGCGGSGSPAASTSTSMDQQILGAAKIAEALAVTMYTSLIASPIFATLPGSDQAYFTAAMNEEMFHYNLLKSSTGNTDAPLTYYFPTGMFTTGAGVATTFSTIVTLEEAFIAAYMFGIQNLSTASLKLLAAQIMGVESEHRALAKTAANDLGLNSTTGLSGVAEPNSPPNNVVYERTFGLNTLNGIVAALTPFFNASAAATAGYTVSATFNPAYSPNGSNLAGNPPS
jgi:hypothetical protein